MYGLDKNYDLSFLIDREVIQICIGQGQFALHFDKKVSIYIENYICIKNGDDYFQFSPKNRDGSKLLIDFLGKKVEKIFIDNDGELKLIFWDEYEIILYENPNYESYTIFQDDHEIIV